MTDTPITPPMEMGSTRSFFHDLAMSFRRPHYWTYSTWMRLGLKYRRTALGPLWIVVGPAFFVIFLGYLFSRVNSSPTDVFVPHMATGYITWTLISGFIIGGSTVFVSRRTEILQGNMRLTDLALAACFDTLLLFLHQAVVILAVFLFFMKAPAPTAPFALLGLLVLFANGLWVTTFLGIIGARQRDLVEVIAAVTRIMFFITPIIWIPQNGTGGFLGAYLVFNPFYHFLEMVRAPLLGTPVATVSYMVVGTITVVGFAVTWLTYRRLVRGVPLWVL
ncbi:MAG: ABC transporter permease [Litorimonas sp.]